MVSGSCGDMFRLLTRRQCSILKAGPSPEDLTLSAPSSSHSLRTSASSVSTFHPHLFKLLPDVSTAIECETQSHKVYAISAAGAAFVVTSSAYDAQTRARECNFHSRIFQLLTSRQQKEFWLNDDQTPPQPGPSSLSHNPPTGPRLGHVSEICIVTYSSCLRAVSRRSYG